MSSEDQTRRTEMEIIFDGADITDPIRPYLLSVTYTDNEEGETDDLKIKVQDRDSVWLQRWLDGVICAASSGTAKAADASGPAAGGVVLLNGVPFYYTSTVESPSAIKSGTYYFYDGVLINGRYRMTNSPDRCGKLPVGKNVTGWVNAEDCAGEVEPPESAADGEPSGGTASGGSGGSSKLKISAAFTQKNWDGGATLPSGDFELDGVTADGPPATVTITGTSLPFSAAIRQTKKTRAWEAYSLSGIAKEIAGLNGLNCLFESVSDPFYERVEQRKTSDSAFLAKLCKDAGISIKATDGQLVLFDQTKYEAQAPVMTIKRGKEGGYIRYSISTGAADYQYSSCHVSYADPATGQCIEGTYTDDAEDTGQCLEVAAKVANAAEAKDLAEKRLRLHNKFARSVSFTFPGNPALVAGVTVQLEDWGGWDGKYIVRQAVHTWSASGGYTTKITARRCLEGY